MRCNEITPLLGEEDARGNCDGSAQAATPSSDGAMKDAELPSNEPGPSSSITMIVFPILLSGNSGPVGSPIVMLTEP